MRALYEAGAQSQLRLLLNQEDSANLVRNSQYYDYLFAARRDKMQVYVEAIQRLNSIEQEVADAVAALKATAARLETEQASLASERDARQKLARAADTELQNKGNALEQLEQDRGALQKVIERIEKQRALARAQEEQRQRAAAEQERLQLEQQEQQARQAQETQKQLAQQQQAARQTQATTAQAAPELQAEPAAPAPQPPAASSASPEYSAEDLARLQSISFTKRKGSMPWPVQGKLVNRFGEKRQGSVTWDGLRIEAAPGSEVHAVHGGRVMYADWLRGQGMLLVLDHGDGFMSLYAHNDVLLREPGEWVHPGDAIARVGNSGGEKESVLYFEIRQNGQPVNPLAWLGKP